jgi:hypothetical protein
VNVATVQRINPPPAMIPNSATPRNEVNDAQKNASAVVTAPVTMPGPIVPAASTRACRTSRPLWRKSRYRDSKWIAKSFPSPITMDANATERMLRCPTNSVAKPNDQAIPTPSTIMPSAGCTNPRKPSRNSSDTPMKEISPAVVLSICDRRISSFSSTGMPVSRI